MNYNPFHEFTVPEDRFMAENVFVGMEPEDRPLPTYEEEKDRLPRPVWDGREDVLSCYDKTWKLAFGNLCRPTPGSSFVSNFIDTAFNGCIFMWDSSFILMFGKYAARSFDFQGTLNNFYSHQYPDGYMCREIEEETGRDHFTRFDPAATGPEVMPWCEWEYFKNFGDRDRLSRVFPCLMAYHRWTRANHTWRDGTYWSSGWGCGMDNLPRVQEGYHVCFSHGHMVWCDACMQALLSCKVLISMAKVLGREDDVRDLYEERERLTKVLNETLWDDKTAFYYDLWKNGEWNRVKHVGAYWALLAGAVPEENADRFIRHLENENEFKTPCRVPSLSKDHPDFDPNGDYWNGGVWAPTTYMTLSGLDAYGRNALSHEIGLNFLNWVVEVFKDTGTVFENYAPCFDQNGRPHRGAPSRGDFVGWTGLAPISILFEFVFGIKPDAEHNVIRWHINLTDRHGVTKYPFGKDATLDLIADARESEEAEPVVHITSDRPVTVEIYWDHDQKRKTLTVGA